MQLVTDQPGWINSDGSDFYLFLYNYVRFLHQIVFAPAFPRCQLFSSISYHILLNPKHIFSYNCHAASKPTCKIFQNLKSTCKNLACTCTMSCKKALSNGTRINKVFYSSRFIIIVILYTGIVPVLAVLLTS